MNNQFIEARELIAKAREALRRGDQSVCAAVGRAGCAPRPRNGGCLAGTRRLRPGSAGGAGLCPKSTAAQPAERAGTSRRGMGLGPVETGSAGAVEGRDSPAAPKVVPNQVGAVTSLPQKRAYQTAVALPQLTVKATELALAGTIGRRRFHVRWLYRIICIDQSRACLHCKQHQRTCATQENLWAPVEIAKPEVTPIDGSAFAAQPADTSARAVLRLRLHPTPAPTDVPAATQHPPTFQPRRPPPLPPPPKHPARWQWRSLLILPRANMCTDILRAQRPDRQQWKWRALDRCGSHQSTGLCL